MTELLAVTAAARALRDHGEAFLVATVVRVHGSSYRRPGARMLVTADRWIAGCVSGGLPRRDIVKRGWWHTSAAPCAVVTYDSSADDQDAGWGVGLGCNGVVDILLERVPAPHAGPVSSSVQALLEVGAAASGGPGPFAMVTVFESSSASVPVGTRWIVGGGDRADVLGGSNAGRRGC